jgi:hypothetical protein
MLTKILLRIPFSVTVDVLYIVEPSLAAGKMHKKKVVTDGFRYDFTEFCMHFQGKNRRFKVFEEGY